MNYKQIFAKKKSVEQQLIKVCPTELNNESGIYWFTREEGGFKYAYIGQARHITDRCVSHMLGYELHIDRSLKKHKLYSDSNPYGWKLEFRNYPAELLNEQEQIYIRRYANAGYQLLNKTSGSQGSEKFGIFENKERKGYRQGKKDGELALIRTIKAYFDKYLDIIIKEPVNKVKMRKFEEFKELLKTVDKS